MTAMQGSKQQSPAAPAVRTESGGEVVAPGSGSYQVQTGDTLAGIALKNYKRVSPRLLDEICKANNLRNANVLSLGQKLALPEYHTQPAQIAGAGQMQ
jgi:nucleoid-associated protein YgaU